MTLAIFKHEEIVTCFSSGKHPWRESPRREQFISLVISPFPFSITELSWLLVYIYIGLVISSYSTVEMSCLAHLLRYYCTWPFHHFRGGSLSWPAVLCAFCERWRQSKRMPSIGMKETKMKHIFSISFFGLATRKIKTTGKLPSFLRFLTVFEYHDPFFQKRLLRLTCVSSQAQYTQHLWIFKFSYSSPSHLEMFFLFFFYVCLP